MLTVLFLLALLAFLGTIAHAAGSKWCPLWVPVLLISLYILLQQIPLGK